MKELRELSVVMLLIAALVLIIGTARASFHSVVPVMTAESDSAGDGSGGEAEEEIEFA